MTLEEIKALPVGELAAPDAVLLLWATDPLLPRALEVGAAFAGLRCMSGNYRLDRMEDLRRHGQAVFNLR